MHTLAIKDATRALLAGALLLCAACAVTGDSRDEGEAVLAWEEGAPPAVDPESEPIPDPDEQDDTAEEGEVPIAVAESEAPQDSAPLEQLDEVVVSLERHDVIRGLVAEARMLLQGVELQYVFTGKGKKETLRGRP